jgi:hypothetical protein
MTTKLLLLTVLLALPSLTADETYVGWVSDSGCASARASVGTYTGTNPDCARRCVKEGKKIVLISQERKTVFTIENPEALRSEIGNKVRVSATAAGKNSLHINKITSSEKSNPKCERPTLKE